MCVRGVSGFDARTQRDEQSNHILLQAYDIIPSTCIIYYIVERAAAHFYNIYINILYYYY